MTGLCAASALAARPAGSVPVSVCVPTYNGERYLTDCLESIRAQSFADFEVLIVDDGSGDATPTIATAFAEKDPRFKFVRNDANLGLVANWNRCVQLARAPWIKFVFHDDLVAPDCLERMLSLAGETGRRLVFCQRRFVFAETIARETVAHYAALPTLESICGGRYDLDPADAVRLFFTGAGGDLNYFGEPTCALIHRDVFDAVGLFETNLIQFCDLEYWLRSVSMFGFAWVPDALASFRVHEGSTSQRNAVRRAFRSEILDRLVIRHQMAYGRGFAALRRLAAPVVSIRKVRRNLAHDAFWAMNQARAATQEPGMWADWDVVAAQYPRLRRSFWHLPLWIKASVQRNLSWRLNRRGAG